MALTGCGCTSRDGERIAVYGPVRGRRGWSVELSVRKRAEFQWRYTTGIVSRRTRAEQACAAWISHGNAILVLSEIVALGSRKYDDRPPALQRARFYAHLADETTGRRASIVSHGNVRGAMVYRVTMGFAFDAHNVRRAVLVHSVRRAWTIANAWDRHGYVPHLTKSEGYVSVHPADGVA